MEYKLQTRPNTPERTQEEEQVRLLHSETLSFQVGFHHLVDGLTLYPDHHAALREQKRFKDLNLPFKRAGYISAGTVGALMDSRWDHADQRFGGWVRQYTQDVLPYSSLVWLAKRAVRELGLPNSASSHNFILNSLWIRIFTQTEEGWQRELTATRFVEAKDGSCSRGTSEDEARHHLDLFSPVAGYQVKTPRFLIRARNAGHREDQLRNFEAQRTWERLTGLPVFYLVATGTDVKEYALDEAVRMCGLTTAA